MTQDNWKSVESSLDDIKSEIYGTKEELSSLDELRLGRRVQDVLNTVYNALSNIEQFADSIYSTCEDDYCDSENDEDELELTDEVRAVLPKASNITLGQSITLANAIRQWREKNGLGIYD